MSIEINNVQFSRGYRFSLSINSIELPQGQLCAILGPSGAGKSTFLSILTGEIMEQSGDVRIGGQNIHEMDVLESACIRSVMHSEEFAWLPLTVSEVIATGTYSHRKILKNERQSFVDQLPYNTQLQIEQLDLTELMNAPYDTLSSGQKQRVQFVRVLLQSEQRTPYYLLLDEPFSHQDPGYAKRMISELNRFKYDGGTAVMVLHDLNLAAQVCDHFMLMNGGQIVCSGSANEVLNPELLEEIYHIPFEAHANGLMPLFSGNSRNQNIREVHYENSTL